MSFSRLLIKVAILTGVCTFGLIKTSHGQTNSPASVVSGGESDYCGSETTESSHQATANPGADFRCKCLCPAPGYGSNNNRGNGTSSSESRDLMAIYLYGNYEGSDICLRKVPLASLGGPFERLAQSDKMGGVSIYGDGKSLYAVTNLLNFRKNRLRGREMGLIGMDSDNDLPNVQRRPSSNLLLQDLSGNNRPDSQIEDKEIQTDFVSLHDYESYLEEYLSLNPNALVLRSGASGPPRNTFNPSQDPSIARGLHALITGRHNSTTDDVANQLLKDLVVHVIWLCITLVSSFTSVLFLLWRFRSDRRTRNANHSTETISPPALSTHIPLTLPDGTLQIGKITFSPKEIIGRGCSGTCVYKGLFEGTTPVAVKRVVADCVVLADREIDLLRSLTHPNLIRYFSTESDHQFRYIAIELAELTLSDYMEFKQMLTYTLDPVQVLKESTEGVCHLHSLNVIHRDLKPHNILISLPQAPHGNRKVMISDFGVSKDVTADLSVSSNVFSLSLMGTEGWIAPELLRSRLERKKPFMTSAIQEESSSLESIRRDAPSAESDDCDPTDPSPAAEQYKANKSADIFSLGCIFYYVLSGGKHPFGDVLSRQANILKGSCDLSALNGEEQLLVSHLLTAMLSDDPAQRPPIDAIISYPLFWDDAMRLQFLQDLSDRTEQESWESPIIRRLEFGHFDVVRGDWRRYLTDELQEDLRRFRSYRGSSVRDLLRALRNKKHHYRELPDRVQESLGSIPSGFLQFFTSRFPRLLIHAYWAVQEYRDEELFAQFYYPNSEAASERHSYVWPLLPKSGLKWFTEETNQLLDKFAALGVGTRRPLPVAQESDENKPIADNDDNNEDTVAPETPHIRLEPNGSPLKKFSLTPNNAGAGSISLLKSNKENDILTMSSRSPPRPPYVKNKRQQIKARRAALRGQSSADNDAAEHVSRIDSAEIIPTSQIQSTAHKGSPKKSSSTVREVVPDLLPAFSRISSN